MGKLPSYEELQHRIVCLENELAKLKSVHPGAPFNVKQSLFFDICENSKTGIALFETKDDGSSFIIKYFNKKAEEIENINRNKVLGKKLSDCFPSTVNSGFIDALKAVYKKRTPLEFPAIVIKSNKVHEWKQNYIYKVSEKEVVSIYMDEKNKKSKELELLEQQEKLKIAMESANYFSFEINPITYKISAPRELYASLGYDITEISELMINSGSLIHPDDFKNVKNSILTNLKKQIFDFNKEFRLKDHAGKWVWFTSAGRNIDWDENKNPSRIVGLLKNIQKEKEIHLKLKESEEKYKSLVNFLPEPILETNLKGKIIFANLKALETFGYSINEIKKGVNIMQFLAPEEEERAKQNTEKLLQLEDMPGEEYIAVSKSGNHFPILIYSNLIKDNKKIKGFRSIVINITERKLTQEKLKESEENFRQLSENINDGFWLRSLDQKIIYANPACYHIVGSNFRYVFENFEAYKNWIHPDDRNRILELRENNLGNPDKEYSYEHRIISPNGQIKWLWIRTFPVYNENGVTYRRAGIISDITEQKKLFSDLVQAKEKAEESDKLKSAFLANMSHEIRTPMNGILGFAELLNDKDTSEEEKEKYLRIINSNGKQLLNLINDIIDVAKIEAKQLIITKEVLEINPFLREIYLIFKKEQKRLKKDNIKFELVLPEDHKQLIYTDVVRIQQILYNLINNAFKFTNIGSVQLGYDRIKKASKSYYRFFIKDSGIGIPENKKDLIFKRFGQIRSKIVLNQTGTGLGLSISKGLIELLGGEIWVESTSENIWAGKPGNTEFSFTIPIVNNLKIKKLKQSTNKTSITMKKLQNVTILIVEDDEHNLEFIKKLLIKFGANVLVAATGKEAIEIASSDKALNLVLMDIRLPDIDGFEVTQKIKQLRPGIPVIAQTAYAMYNDRKLCLENGCDDYIAKPLNKEVLYKKINDYIYS